MSTAPKKQHFVSQFILNNFLDPNLEAQGQNMLWVYEAGKEPRKAAPKEVAFENYFYSIGKEGDKILTFENALAKLESLTAPIINEKLAVKGFNLTKEERDTLAFFVALQFTRTPVFFNELNDLRAQVEERRKVAPIEGVEQLEWLLSQSGETGDLRVKADELRIQLQAQENLATRAWSLWGMFDIALRLSPLIADMKWAFVVSKGEDRFVTSDSAISLYDPKATGFWGPGLASSDKSEFRFPVTREICLLGHWGQVEGEAPATPSFVRSVNKNTMWWARRFVYASEESNKLRNLLDHLAIVKKS